MPTRTKAKEQAAEQAAAAAAAEQAAEQAAAAETFADGAAAEATDADYPAQKPIRLVGQELLDLLGQRRLQGVSHSDIAREAGYYSFTKDGLMRTQESQFNKQILVAEGHTLDSRPVSGGRNQDGLAKARVSEGGLLLVSKKAVEKVGGIIGSVFTVEFPYGDLTGPGSQILLTLTPDVVQPVPRKRKGAEVPDGNPLLDHLEAVQAADNGETEEQEQDEYESEDEDRH